MHKVEKGSLFIWSCHKKFISWMTLHSNQLITCKTIFSNEQSISFLIWKFDRTFQFEEFRLNAFWKINCSRYYIIVLHTMIYDYKTCCWKFLSFSKTNKKSCLLRCFNFLFPRNVFELCQMWKNVTIRDKSQQYILQFATSFKKIGWLLFWEHYVANQLNVEVYVFGESECGKT